MAVPFVRSIGTHTSRPAATSGDPDVIYGHRQTASREDGGTHRNRNQHISRPDTTTAIQLDQHQELVYSTRRYFQPEKSRQDTKYASVVQALPASIVEEVEDILLNTPDQLHTPASKAILKRTGRSDEDLIRDLFSNVSLGDRTPSQLPRLMKSRLGNNTMAEPILRGLWMDRLPPNITQVLALVPVETPLDVVADSADKIYSQAHQKVHQVESHGNHTQRLEEEMTQLRAELRDLKLSLCRRQRSPAPRTRNRSRTRSSSPGRRNIDTGAAISVIPPTNRSALKPTPFQLRAANGSTIETYGDKELTLNINLRRDFKWSFTVADVRIPLLGADFLAHYNLAVHMKTRTLSDNTTSIKITGIPSSFNTTRISVATQHDPRYVEILRRYKHLTQPIKLTDAGDHQTQHHIGTTGQPAYSRPRRLPPHKLAYAKKAFEEMLADNIIRPSDSPYAQSSPTIHVPQQLQDCEFIFVRNDAVKKPLTPTYQGPFKVLKRSEKHLTIDRGSRTATISIDRVKPAFLEKSPRETEPVSTHPEPSPASTTTQSQPSQPSFQHSCSLQLTQQLPAASSSPLRRSTDVPLPIPAPADDLIQCPLTSSAR
ncbi:unnamed protein product [Acanthosepion pharaonis]|uniref:Uncharacterized protein n=1 Tax=Acanthosepion pharaonis TaxID=158019 RepID=A0A812E443_ACAPH|nr:unnamed protein product [Sepia pharaonis]